MVYLFVKTFVRRYHTYFCIHMGHWTRPYVFEREAGEEIEKTHLLAPPASGETMVQFFHSLMFSFIHLRTAGSAYKLSTGMSKNPWQKKTHWLKIIPWAKTFMKKKKKTVKKTLCPSLETIKCNAHPVLHVPDSRVMSLISVRER